MVEDGHYNNITPVVNMDKKISTLQRRIKSIKDKVKDRMKKGKRDENLEVVNEDSSDFVWIGGFNHRTLPTTPKQKRKLSFSGDDDDESDEDDDMIMSPDTIELQMAWYKNFHIRFFEDEVQVRSPMKRQRQQLEIQHSTSTPLRKPSVNEISAQIRTFRDFFDAPSAKLCQDFKIYDDYHYPTTPLLTRRSSEYRNLVPGNTPAPPLPPRNAPKPRPPTVFRNYKEVEFRPKPFLLDENLNQIFLKRSHSLHDINDYSYLL